MRALAAFSTERKISEDAWLFSLFVLSTLTPGLDSPPQLFLQVPAACPSSFVWCPQAVLSFFCNGLSKKKGVCQGSEVRDKGSIQRGRCPFWVMARAPWDSVAARVVENIHRAPAEKALLRLLVPPSAKNRQVCEVNRNCLKNRIVRNNSGRMYMAAYAYSS